MLSAWPPGIGQPARAPRAQLLGNLNILKAFVSTSSKAAGKLDSSNAAMCLRTTNAVARTRAKYSRILAAMQVLQLDDSVPRVCQSVLVACLRAIWMKRFYLSARMKLMLMLGCSMLLLIRVNLVLLICRGQRRVQDEHEPVADELLAATRRSQRFSII